MKITKAQPRTVPATPANDQGQSALVSAELGEFFLLLARQLGDAAVVVDLGLGHPVPQTGFRNPQFFGDHRDRLLAQTSKVHGLSLIHI